MTDPTSGDDGAEAAPPSVRRRDLRSSAPAEPAEKSEALHAQLRHAREEFESQVTRRRDQFDQANEKIKERTGRDLFVAIAIGLVLGAAVLSTLLFLKWLFVLFALAASIIGTVELARALQVSGRRIDLAPHLVVGSLLVVTGAFASPWLHWIALFAAVAVVVVWRLIGQMHAADGRTYGDVASDIGSAALLQIYVPFLASVCMMLLREPDGEWWILAFVIIAVAADTGAYAVGVAIGRHPMVPLISPNKTWEGFAGAATAAILAGVLLALFMLHIPWWAGVVFGVVILVTATLGDLAESMIKRDLGIKDMSSWLPGHGGVLDRLDSVLLSTVPALGLYYLLSPLVTP